MVTFGFIAILALVWSIISIDKNMHQKNRELRDELAAATGRIEQLEAHVQTLEESCRELRRSRSASLPFRSTIDDD